MTASPAGARLRVDDGYRFWRIVWRVGYLVVRRLGWLTRLLAAMGVPSFANNIIELELTGRRSGRDRTVLVTLLRLNGAWYVGHPNGRAPWLANLESAGVVKATVLGQATVRVRSVPLPLGEERTAVIRETSRQQLIPARPLYWAARRHILRAGVYHRLELVER